MMIKKSYTSFLFDKYLNNNNNNQKSYYLIKSNQKPFLKDIKSFTVLYIGNIETFYRKPKNIISKSYR